MNQYGFCDYPTPDTNGVCQGCGYKPCRDTKVREAIEHGCTFNQEGTAIDDMGNEYRDENGAIIIK